MQAPAPGGLARVGKTLIFQASIGWRQEMDMEAVYRRCAGLDVHKDVIEVCVLPPAGQSGSPQRRRFATFTSDLIRLRMWLVH